MFSYLQSLVVLSKHLSVDPTLAWHTFKTPVPLHVGEGGPVSMSVKNRAVCLITWKCVYVRPAFLEGHSISHV